MSSDSSRTVMFSTTLVVVLVFIVGVLTYRAGWEHGWAIAVSAVVIGMLLGLIGTVAALTRSK